MTKTYIRALFCLYAIAFFHQRQRMTMPMPSPKSYKTQLPTLSAYLFRTIGILELDRPMQCAKRLMSSLSSHSN